jgi:acyl-coenzyme A synthetase/AMP-(fatty) acid ligase
VTVSAFSAAQQWASAARSNVLVDGRDGSSSTWDALAPAALPGPAAVAVRSGFDALPAVIAHADQGTELLVVSANRLDEGLVEDLLALGLTVTTTTDVRRPAQVRAGEPGRLWLLTSGTTGRPKRVGHTLTSLATVAGRQPPRRWLCPYSPGTYAWWQVVTLSLTCPRQDVVFVDPADLDAWPRLARAHGVTAVSGTPTFWRRALMTAGDELAGLALEQVTLGGEPVDQAVLDLVAEAFPQARVSWIYASSEVGASVVVHDGRAGFPTSWLDRPVPGRPVLSVVDDELVVVSPHHGAGLDGAVRTGDRVEVRDGRVHVTGRLDGDEINVGGAKVSAAAVRDVLHGHPGVAWAAVAGRRAPMVGHVVVADVVATDPAVTEPALAAWCRASLPEHAVPRRFRLLPEIPTKESLKSDV